MAAETIATPRNGLTELSFRVERRPYCLVVSVAGEASFKQAEVISATLLRIPLEKYALVVLDLSGLSFISSLAMRALVEYRRGLRWRGIEIRLANVQPDVWFAIGSAGLWEVFETMELDLPAPSTSLANHGAAETSLREEVERPQLLIARAAIAGFRVAVS